MDIEQIKKLVEKLPNDIELGEAVRAAYWKVRKLEQAKNPSQLSIFNDEDRDDAVLGYD